MSEAQKAAPLETVPAKTLVTRNKSTAWFGCEYNMNIYRGCSHGCLYCDSRSDCYHNERFDTVKAKADALRILRDDLARKVQKGVVATGAMSDPYNPREAEAQHSRNALALLDAYDFGVAVATKSDLIARDIDILREIDVHSPVLCKLTLTTTDDELAAKLEPGAPSPTRRLAAMEKLAGAGLFTGTLLMPVMPHLEDSEAQVLEVVRRSAAAGARFIYAMFGVTMRPGQREYLLAGLERAFPGQGVAEKYRRFGGRYICPSPREKRLWQVFTQACRERGLLFEMRDIIAAYRAGKGRGQLSFL